MWNEIQWAASAFGIVGAITNSVGGRILRLTWPIWLLSNVLAIAALWHIGAHGFLAQQTFYLGTTVIGGFRQFFPRQWEVLTEALGPVDNQQVQMKAAESATNDENRSESLS